MTQLRYPATDRDRLTVLRESAIWAARDRAVSLLLLPGPLQIEIETFLVTYEPAYSEMRTLRSRRGLVVNEKQEAVADLVRYVRDFWAGMERRIIREKLPESDFMAYNQVIGGKNDTGNRLQDWLNRSESIIKGDVLIVARGIAPMSNPTAAEVAAVRAIAVAKSLAVTNADRSLDHAQHVMDALRPEANRLLRMVNANINLAMYGRSSEDIRNAKRRYGFEFYERPLKVEEKGE